MYHSAVIVPCLSVCPLSSNRRRIRWIFEVIFYLFFSVISLFPRWVSLLFIVSDSELVAISIWNPVLCPGYFAILPPTSPSPRRWGIDILCTLITVSLISLCSVSLCFGAHRHLHPLFQVFHVRLSCSLLSWLFVSFKNTHSALFFWSNYLTLSSTVSTDNP